MQLLRASGSYLRSVGITRTLACAIAAAGFAAAAHADDVSVDSMKDQLPTMPNLSTAGVTVYGVIDVGYGYQTHGYEYSGALYTGQQYQIYGSNEPAHAISSLTNNALSTSAIGVKVEESIGLGFTAIANIDTNFNPLSGEIADACASLVRLANALKNGTTIQAYGDGSRCGQAINDNAWAGLSSSTYGTLTVGRQWALMNDAALTYDPMAESYALSPLGWSGFFAAGVGSTETARWDNSVKYIFQYGPAHAAVMYADGGPDSSIQGSAWGADAGITYKGFSIDGLYTNERGAVNAQLGTLGAPGPLAGTDVNDLYYFLTDNEAWSVMGKYTFELGCCCCESLKDGGLKDQGPSDKVTVFAGYVHTDMTRFDDNGIGYGPGKSGGTTIGGYVLLINNIQLLSTRTIQTEWAGAKYETGPWAFVGAYYHASQSSFSEDNYFATNNPPHVGGVGGCNINAFACSGDYDEASALVDYTFNKHFDIYAGIGWSDIKGGLAHSSTSNDAYVQTDNTTVVTGMRLKF
ncbi:MAG: porin [Rhodomicrobium sp.]